ncbi:MAG: motility associated factor glycosyltransferase family protein, partial [Shewanella sp.]
MAQTSLFDSQLSIIKSRWPKLAQQLNQFTIDDIHAQLKVELTQGLEQTISINGIQLSSRHDRYQEAAAWCQGINEACSHVDCYGIGMGDTPWYLLTVKKVAALTLHCLNLKLLKLLLTCTDQREWLTHPNLELVSAPARPSLGAHWL